MSHLPPHDPFAEKAVIGAVLVRPEALAIVREILEADDFYLPIARSIYETMLILSDSLQPIDMVTLAGNLQTRGLLETIGGIEAISAITDEVPTATRAGHYAEIVRTKAILRNAGLAARRILDESHGYVEDVESWLATSQRLVAEAAGDRVKQGYVPVSQVAAEQWEVMQKPAEDYNGLAGVSTGYDDLDHKLMDLQPDQVIILAGRPSMGKSALANCIAVKVATRGVGVLYATLEMSTLQVWRRQMALVSGIPTSIIQTRQFEPDDYKDLVRAQRWFAAAPLWIDDSAGLTPGLLRARVRRLTAEHEIGLVVVDYLQLMRPGRREQSRELEVAAMSRQMKELAKEFHIPVLVLSQLNRKLEDRADKRPIMADLRESGAIEQDADVVLFVYRDEVYNPDDDNKGDAEIIIAKQREGGTGRVQMRFEGPTTQFFSLERRRG